MTQPLDALRAEMQMMRPDLTSWPSQSLKPIAADPCVINSVKARSMSGQSTN